MSLNFKSIPSVKYVFVSYYLVISGCRCLTAYKQKVINSLESTNKFSTDSINLSCSGNRSQRREPPWKIIYFGTDLFSLTCLRPINAKFNTGTLISKLAVVSKEKSAVLRFAESEKLAIYKWPPSEEILSEFDLGIVVSYGKLIPANIINALPLGILNVHGSILPRWRGAAPIAYAIMNGDAESGVTIMRIKPEKFDIGDMVRQYRCPIAPNDTTPELTKRLANNAADLLIECIRDLPRCLDHAVPQPNEGVTYAPRINASLSFIKWKEMSAQNVFDRHRAISYKYPLTTKWFDKPTRLLNIQLDDGPTTKSSSKKSSMKSALDFLNRSESAVSKNQLNFDIDPSAIPGKISYNHASQTVKVQCADGNWIKVGNIKISSGRIINSKDFLNGFLSKTNKQDWRFSD